MTTWQPVWLLSAACQQHFYCQQQQPIALLEQAVQLQVCSAAVDALCSLPAMQDFTLEDAMRLLKALQGPAAIAAPRSLLTWLVSLSAGTADGQFVAAAGLAVEQLQAAAAMHDVAGVRALCSCPAVLALSAGEVAEVFIGMAETLQHNFAARVQQHKQQLLQQQHHHQMQQGQHQQPQRSILFGGHLPDDEAFQHILDAVLGLPQLRAVTAAQLSAIVAAAARNLGSSTVQHLLMALPLHAAAVALPPDLAAGILAAATAAGDSDCLFHLRSWLPANQQLDAAQLELALKSALRCTQPSTQYGSSECVRRLLELPAAAAVTARQAARLLANAQQPGSSSSDALVDSR